MTKTVYEALNIAAGKPEDHIEESIFTEDVILPKGINLELYGNPDGKYENEDPSQGSSTFVQLSKDYSFGELISKFSYLGQVNNDTLAIHIVDSEDNELVSECIKNQI